MSHAQKHGNVYCRIMSAWWASSPMWRVCMQDNVCVAREGVSSGRGINHRFQFWAWALIFCYRSSVFSDGPMPMHAPSERFLGGGGEAARLHVLLFLVSPQLHP